MLGYVTSKVIMKENVCAVVSDPMQIIMSQEDFIIKNLLMLENKKYLQIFELERPTDMAMSASTMFSNRIPSEPSDRMKAVFLFIWWLDQRASKHVLHPIL